MAPYLSRGLDAFLFWDASTYHETMIQSVFCSWDRTGINVAVFPARVAMRGDFPATTIAPVPMSAGNRGSRGVPGPKVGKNERKPAMEPHSHPATVWIPVVPLASGAPLVLASGGSRLPRVPEAPVSKFPGFLGYHAVPSIRQSRLLRARNPPPNPHGPMLSGSEVSLVAFDTGFLRLGLAVWCWFLGLRSQTPDECPSV